MKTLFHLIWLLVLSLQASDYLSPPNTTILYKDTIRENETFSFYMDESKTYMLHAGALKIHEKPTITVVTSQGDTLLPGKFQNYTTASSDTMTAMVSLEGVKNHGFFLKVIEQDYQETPFSGFWYLDEHRINYFNRPVIKKFSEQNSPEYIGFNSSEYAIYRKRRKRERHENGDVTSKDSVTSHENYLWFFPLFRTHKYALTDSTLTFYREDSLFSTTVIYKPYNHPIEKMPLRYKEERTNPVITESANGVWQLSGKRDFFPSNMRQIRRDNFEDLQSVTDTSIFVKISGDTVTWYSYRNWKIRTKQEFIGTSSRFRDAYFFDSLFVIGSIKVHGIKYDEYRPYDGALPPKSWNEKMSIPGKRIFISEFPQAFTLQDDTTWIEIMPQEEGNYTITYFSDFAEDLPIIFFDKTGAKIEQSNIGPSSHMQSNVMGFLKKDTKPRFVAILKNKRMRKKRVHVVISTRPGYSLPPKHGVCGTHSRRRLSKEESALQKAHRDKRIQYLKHMRLLRDMEALMKQVEEETE